MVNTVESVKKLILDAVQKASGLVTVFAPANGPEPANQYCLVTLKSIEQQDNDVINWIQGPNSVTERQRSESTMEFEIQVRGANAMTIGDKVKSYFSSELRDIDLWPYVGSGGDDELQNISTYHQGKILPIAVFNLYIHTTLPKQNVIEYMNSVDITTKIVDNEITITIPEED